MSLGTWPHTSYLPSSRNTLLTDLLSMHFPSSLLSLTLFSAHSDQWRELCSARQAESQYSAILQPGQVSSILSLVPAFLQFRHL